MCLGSQIATTMAVDGLYAVLRMFEATLTILSVEYQESGRSRVGRRFVFCCRHKLPHYQ